MHVCPLEPLRSFARPVLYVHPNVSCVRRGRSEAYVPIVRAGVQVHSKGECSIQGVQCMAECEGAGARAPL